jgi:hypothetical protein
MLGLVPFMLVNLYSYTMGHDSHSLMTKNGSKELKQFFATFTSNTFTHNRVAIMAYRVTI